VDRACGTVRSGSTEPVCSDFLRRGEAGQAVVRDRLWPCLGTARSISAVWARPAARRSSHATTGFGRGRATATIVMRRRRRAAFYGYVRLPGITADAGARRPFRQAAVDWPRGAQILPPVLIGRGA